MNDVEQPHNGGAVVGDGSSAIHIYEFVHSSWTERGSNGFGHRHAGINVRNDLTFSLAGVRPLSEQNNLGLERGLHGVARTLHYRIYNE